MTQTAYYNASIVCKGFRLASLLFKKFVSPPLRSTPPSFKVFQTVTHPHADNPPPVLIQHTNLPYTYTQVHF